MLSISILRFVVDLVSGISFSGGFDVTSSRLRRYRLFLFLNKIFLMLDSSPLLLLLKLHLIWKLLCKCILILFCILVKLFHTCTICARHRAILMVYCFDRDLVVESGLTRQTVRLHHFKCVLTGSAIKMVSVLTSV